MVFVLAGWASSVAFASSAISSKSALLEFYTPELRPSEVEVCFTSLCELYRFDRVASVGAWDTVFIHQYFFVAPTYREEFRAKYAMLAEELLLKYRGICPHASQDQLPKCLLTKLASRHRIKYASVRYDEGNRCWAWGRLTEPSYLGRSTCRKEKHAS